MTGARKMSANKSWTGARKEIMESFYMKKTLNYSSIGKTFFLPSVEAN
jgi:hypothetical protein